MIDADKPLHNIAPLRDWESPASYYPRLQLGEAKIATAMYDSGDYHCYMTSPPGNDKKYSFFRAERELPITELQIEGKTWMVDDPPHWWGMQEHANEFHGHVLCAGLGLGLIAHALDANPDVESVTIIERNADVIKLINPLIPSGKVIHADWHEYEPDRKFDCVLFDLFVGSGEELKMAALREMVQLRQRFPGAKTRIHGMSNEWLNATATAAVEGQQKLENMLKK